MIKHYKLLQHSLVKQLDIASYIYFSNVLTMPLPRLFFPNLLITKPAVKVSPTTEKNTVPQLLGRSYSYIITYGRDPPLLVDCPKLIYYIYRLLDFCDLLWFQTKLTEQCLSCLKFWLCEVIPLARLFGIVPIIKESPECPNPIKLCIRFQVTPNLRPALLCTTMI